MDLQKSRIACVGMLAATVSFAVAKESPLSLPPGVKEKIDALVQAQPAQRVSRPGSLLRFQRTAKRFTRTLPVSETCLHTRQC